MNRAYNIQINVGDMDHELMGLSDQDIAAWVRGFQLGLHGKGCQPGHGASADCGNRFGYACYERTKTFMEKSAEGGRKSAESRRAKHGTAQPEAKPKVVRESTEGGSMSLRVNAELTRNQKPETNNEQPETKKDKVANAPRFSPPSVADVDAYCDQNGYTIDCEAFVDFYESKGWKVGNSPMKDWKAAVRTWVKRDAAKPKPAQVCPHPPGTEAAYNWWNMHGDFA